VRPATVDDIAAVSALERTCFESDRLSRRQFRYLLTKANAAVFIAEDEAGRILGDLVMLFSRGTSMARLYSIAVDPEARGRGIARALVERAESEAWKRERAYLRLEVRKDNRASIGLFERLGYRRFGEYSDYYADHMGAWRYEKQLMPDIQATLAPVRYYEQTLDFTCGPASLMMAMATFRPELQLDRKLELRLWREATTIFMTSGHGGCGPYGLALAAARRGFTVSVRINDPGVHLVDTVRSEEKKEVMRLVQEDMADEIARRGIPVLVGPLSVNDLEAEITAGGVPLVLISSWQIYEERSPHWVVVAGFDEHFVYANDPFVDYAEGETPTDSIQMPIGRALFERMAQYGRKGLKAAVIVRAGTPADTP
jgi:ribosomal protein S18 acetylase RimI-like enzyme